MSKRKKMSTLPTMERLEPGQIIRLEKDERIEPAKPHAQMETLPPDPRVVSISIVLPFIVERPAVASYQDESSRVDMGTLTRDRLRKLQALRRGYVTTCTRMAGGAEVRTNRDALYCLLDALDI